MNKNIVPGLISNNTSATNKTKILVKVSRGLVNVNTNAFLITFKEVLENRLISNEINGVINRSKIKSPKKIQLIIVLLKATLKNVILEYKTKIKINSKIQMIKLCLKFRIKPFLKSFNILNPLFLKHLLMQ